MTEQVKERLLYLADKYESADFLLNDPAKFMHRYSNTKDIETAAFIAADLAFGQRKQILSHVEYILSLAGKSPSEWILSARYADFFGESRASFYRMYSFFSMRLFFDALRNLLIQAGSSSLGDYLSEAYQAQREDGFAFPAQFIASFFPDECDLIPHSKNAAAKKLNMLLRWMVRTDSPVDLGLWKGFSKSELLMPLDTHVMRQATKLKLLLPARSKDGKTKPRSPSLKAAIALTNTMREAFGSDPVRGDFALFGLGADESASAIE